MANSGVNDVLSVSVDGAVVTVTGDVDLAGGPILDAAIAGVEDQHEEQHEVILDLSAVTFIDSSGLRTLLAASRRARANGSMLVLRAPSAEVLRLLDITSTGAQFDIESPDR